MHVRSSYITLGINLMGNDVIEYNITVKKVPSVVLREGVIDKLAYMPILNYKYRTISTVPIK